MRFLAGIVTAAHAGTFIDLPQASTVAQAADNLYDFTMWISFIGLALVTVGMIYFVMAFHRSKKGRKTERILGSHFLEALWTFIPLVLFLGIFAWGYRDYLKLRSEPKNPYEINIVGRQWMWNMEYTNGRKTLNELYLPKDRPVKLIMTSEDVIHSFFLPHFRLKQDVVPGMYTYLSFTATEGGVHPVYCAEYCGTGHSDMLAKAVVLESADFDRWVETGKLPAGMKVAEAAAPGAGAPAAAGAGKSLAEKGRELYNSKGCFACHTTDGTPKVGPSFAHIWGKTENLENGGTATVDENYVRESMMEPQAKIVKGFPPSMPTFKGLLSDEDVNALIAFIKSLK